MKFLCLHGQGSNSKIFESQTAALRYELGDHHTYEFVEGTIATQMDPDLKDIYSPVDEFFEYVNIGDLESCVAALDYLESYLRAEGPFDAVLAFSQGAALIVSYLMRRAQRESPYLDPASFKCAVLFSPVQALNPELLSQSSAQVLNGLVHGVNINTPTALIWGSNDAVTDAASISGLFYPDKSETYMHDGGHEIPGPRMKDNVRSIVQLIRRVVSLSTYRQ
ncbi:DUF341 domain protein [Xylaria digitata]|nr:DUF341 domain protein [Xylaria digitata]